MTMRRREFLGMAGGAAIAAATLRTHAQPSQDNLPPNIVLCMADDQGWGDMAYNGHPIVQTPHFDAAAAACLRFDRFYAAAPVCSPTRGSVMTGRHPNRFGCFTWGYPLRPQEITLPKALKTAGYVTGHFGKWHLGPVENGSETNPGASGFDEWLSAPNFYDNDPILSRNGRAEVFKGESSMVAVDAAIAFMQRQSQSKSPFLAVVWFGSPHKPHTATEELRSLYPAEDEKHGNFYGEITGMDRAFGKLRSSLREMGIHENTILWYNSDNGGLPEVGSTGGRGHKADIYEGGLRVPAFVEWPRVIQSPRVASMPCGTVDIYPTLIDIAGVKVKNQPVLDGISLRKSFEDNMTERPAPMGFWRYPAKGIVTPSDTLMAELLESQRNGVDTAHPELLEAQSGQIDKTYPENEYPGHAAWLAWPWKLHRIDEKEQSGTPAYELYNLKDDPQESLNRMEDEERIAAEMTHALGLWQASVVRSLNGADYAESAGVEQNT
ncbi:MAG: N-acetylgalactosamine-6-sulfatase [Candidatus Hydrogenedentota bacterium]